MSNSKKLNEAVTLLESIIADLDEKLDLIQAEETHGSIDPAREDDWADAKQSIEDAIELLNEAEVKL